MTVDLKIKQFIQLSGLPLSQFAEIIGEKCPFALKWWNGFHRIQLSDRHIENFLFYFSSSAEEFFSYSFTELFIDRAREKFLKAPIQFNEKYFIEAESKVRTTAHIIKYLSYRYGRQKVDRILHSMHIHPSLFSNLDNKINIHFFLDLLQESKKLGLTDGEVHYLSTYLFLSLQNTNVGQIFNGASNHRECFDLLNQNWSHFDRNFEYQMELREDGFSLKMKPGDFLSQLMVDHKVDVKDLMFYRKNLACWFPYLAGLPPVSGTLKKSVAFGDVYCEIEAHFPELSQSKRPKRPQMQIV